MTALDPEVVVTSALPYANGPIHIGHLVEYVQTDIYVRFLKLLGKRAVYCCADDTHGTAIEINAAKEGVSPEDFIARWQREHREDFKAYGIAFDSYYTTNSPENQALAESFYAKLQAAGYIYEKEIEQLYADGRFLPDRYVKGECPKCGAPDQYGDHCEKCGATYRPTDLLNPRSVLSGATPVLKKSTHLFFKLSAVSGWLKEWLLQHERLQPEVRNQMLGWIEKGLEDWCISRDGPYFGFRIPGTEKYFYVWLDAPMGYISSLAHLLGGVERAERVWNRAEVQHFIGKDITYFHLLFWPALLHLAGWKVPENVVVHGFLTVNGEKMSKSRGTFLTAREFAAKVPDTEFLRFYYAANLGHAMTDVDLNLRDFRERVNKELVGNVANFIYRTLSFTRKNYGGKLGARAVDERAKRLEEEVVEKEQEILSLFQQYEFRKAVQLMLRLADLGNAYFQAGEPWKEKDASLPLVTTCVNLVKDLSILLAPITPRFSQRVQEQLNLTGLSFKDLGFTLDHHEIGTPAILWRPIEPLIFEDLARREETPAMTGNADGATGSGKTGRGKTGSGKTGSGKTGSGKTGRGKTGSGKTGRGKSGRSTATGNGGAGVEATPSILRLIVAKIVKVERHPNAEKLYIEHLDDGSGRDRVIVSGLVPYYTGEELLGKHIILVDNLKPAKLRGVVSEGMLLAAEHDGTVEVLEAAAAPGTPVLVEGFEQGEREITIDEFFSLTMKVRAGKVFCEGKPLLVGGEQVTTRKVLEGTVG